MATKQGLLKQGLNVHTFKKNPPPESLKPWCSIKSINIASMKCNEPLVSSSLLANCGRLLSAVLTKACVGWHGLSH